MQKGRTDLEPLKTIISMTQDTITESRRIMAELRPSLLDDVWIIATMGWLCRNFSTVHRDVDIEEQLDVEEDEVPEPLKIIILRIVQEAFHNIAKYSQARSVRISLSRQDEAIELAVTDNGIGFNPDSVFPGNDSSGGIGLTSMRERTELSGGTFRVTSRKGEGTTVSASWPLAQGETTLRTE